MLMKVSRKYKQPRHLFLVCRVKLLWPFSFFPSFTWWLRWLPASVWWFKGVLMLLSLLPVGLETPLYSLLDQTSANISMLSGKHFDKWQHLFVNKRFLFSYCTIPLLFPHSHIVMSLFFFSIGFPGRMFLPQFYILCVRKAEIDTCLPFLTLTPTQTVSVV